MFDLFKSDTSLAVDGRPNEVLPGATVELKATLEGELDDRIEGLHIGVRCVSRYTGVRWDSTDKEWDRETRSETVWEEWREPKGPVALGSHSETFELPADALPSVEGAIEWEGVARLARRRAKDVSEEWQFAVLLPAERYAARERDPAEVDGEGDATMRVDVPRRVAAGEPLAGAIVVVPKEEVTARKVVVELRTKRIDRAEVEEAGADALSVGDTRITIHGSSISLSSRRSEIEAEETHAEVELEGGDLAPGQEYRFPFELHVPGDAPPGLEAPNTELRWWLHAKLERRLRGDVSVSLPLNVYNAAGPTA